MSRLSMHITYLHCRAYNNNCFGFLRSRTRVRKLLEVKLPDEAVVERGDRSSLPKVGYIPNFIGRPSSFGSLSEREQNRMNSLSESNLNFC